MGVPVAEAAGSGDFRSERPGGCRRAGNDLGDARGARGVGQAVGPAARVAAAAGRGRLLGQCPPGGIRRSVPVTWGLRQRAVGGPSCGLSPWWPGGVDTWRVQYWARLLLF